MSNNPQQLYKVDASERNPKLGGYYFCIVRNQEDGSEDIETIVEYGQFINGKYAWAVRNALAWNECMTDESQVIAWYEKVSLPSNEAEQQCEHLPVIDTGVGYYFCPACKGSWTPEQFKAIEFKATPPAETNTPESADKILGIHESDNDCILSLTARSVALSAMEEYANQFKAQQQVDPAVIWDVAALREEYELHLERIGNDSNWIGPIPPDKDTYLSSLNNK